VGQFKFAYDPEANTGLPRPFRLGEKLRAGRATHQLKIPKNPRRNEKPQSYIEPTFFLFPHQHRRLKHLKAKAATTVGLTKTEYRLYKDQIVGGGKGAGQYVRWVTGYKKRYDPLTGKVTDVPIFKYEKVPDFERLSTTQAGQQTILTFLWKYNRPEYWKLQKSIDAWRQDVRQKSKHDYEAYLENWRRAARAQARAYNVYDW